MTAKIYSPAKTAMQSGKANTKKWLLVYEIAATRSIDPLMGWPSNSDTNQQLKLRFSSLEAAEKYARKNHLQYVIIQPHSQLLHKQAYAENFIGSTV